MTSTYRLYRETESSWGLEWERVRGGKVAAERARRQVEREAAAAAAAVAVAAADDGAAANLNPTPTPTPTTDGGGNLGPAPDPSPEGIVEEEIILPDLPRDCAEVGCFYATLVCGEFVGK